MKFILLKEEVTQALREYLRERGVDTKEGTVIYFSRKRDGELCLEVEVDLPAVKSEVPAR